MFMFGIIIFIFRGFLKFKIFVFWEIEKEFNIGCLRILFNLLERWGEGIKMMDSFYFFYLNV